jgi:hypothetical protein
MHQVTLLVFSLAVLLSVHEAYSSSLNFDMHGTQRSRAHPLRRCTSLFTELSHATSLKNFRAVVECSPLVYSPANSKGQDLDLHSHMESSFYKGPLRRNVDAASITGEMQRVYTRLQTQLYPGMEF